MVTIIEIVSLAFVNAINPCALAALVMVLISILIANEDKRYKILLGGFSFVLAVFIGYFVYGLIIIKLFQSFTGFAAVVTPYVRNILAVLAIFVAEDVLAVGAIPTGSGVVLVLKL